MKKFTADRCTKVSLSVRSAGKINAVTADYAFGKLF